MDNNNKEGAISIKNFQEMINRLDVIYFKGEFDGKLLIHNKALNKILGLDPSIDLTGSPASQFFSDLKVQQNYHDKLEKYGFVKNFNVKIKKPNGSNIYIEVNAHLIREGDQKFVEGTATDITEKFMLEQSLRDTVKKFNLIVDNSNDLFAIFNQDFQHEYVNENAYLNVLGYTKDEVIGKRAIDFTHPNDIEKISKATKRGLINGEMLEEFRIRHKDGHYVWFETKGSFLKEKSQIIGAIFISRDKTDKKEAEQKLKESENKYRTLFESSTDGIYSTDMEGKFIEFNKAFLKMLGYSREELLNKKSRQITPPKWYDLDDNMTFTQLAEEESKSYEKEFKQKDGSIIPISVRFWILHDDQGDPYRIWAIARDITDRKQMEHELKEVNRLKSEFLRRASHELKTPLVSIKGFTDLILTEYSEDLNSQIVSNL